MSFRILYLIIILGQLFLGCVFDKDVRKLVVINQSYHPVYYQLLPYSEVSLKNVDYIERVPYMKVLPGDSAMPLFARNNEDWTQKIYEVSKDSTFRLFIFNVDTVKKHGWSYTLLKRLYCKYDLKPGTLDTMKWRFIFRQ